MAFSQKEYHQRVLCMCQARLIHYTRRAFCILLVRSEWWRSQLLKQLLSFFVPQLIGKALRSGLPCWGNQSMCEPQQPHCSGGWWSRHLFLLPFLVTLKELFYIYWVTWGFTFIASRNNLNCTFFSALWDNNDLKYLPCAQGSCDFLSLDLREILLCVSKF